MIDIEAVEAKDHDEATKTAVEQFDKPMVCASWLRLGKARLFPR